jgi:outer membrane protein assembly factor BamB
MVGARVSQSDAREMKLCPRCGRASDIDQIRCPHCLADMTQATAIGAEDAELAVEADRKDDEFRARRRRRRTQREIWTRRVIAVSIVALIGWWVYSNFIYTPPPVPIASNPAIAVVASPQSWPVEGGTPQGTRVIAAPSFVDGSPAWSVDMRVAVKTALVSDGTLLYVTTVDNRIVALDIATGEERWTARLQNAPYAAPAVAGDRLYVALLRGGLAAYSTVDGSEIWEVDSPRGNFQASPVVLNGVVYTFGTQGIWGFDAITGKLLLESPHGNTWAITAPVVTGDYLLAATGREVRVINRKSGLQSYFLEFARSTPMSIVVDGTEAFAVYRNTASAFHVTESRPWWEPFRAAWSQAWIIGWAPPTTPPPTIWAAGAAPRESLPAVLDDGRLLIAGKRGELMALDRATGSTLWETSTPFVVAPPVMTQDGLLLMHRDHFSLVDPATGDTVREQATPGELLSRFMVTSQGLVVVTETGTVALRR